MISQIINKLPTMDQAKEAAKTQPNTFFAGVEWVLQNTQRVVQEHTITVPAITFTVRRR